MPFPLSFPFPLRNCGCGGKNLSSTPFLGVDTGPKFLTPSPPPGAGDIVVGLEITSGLSIPLPFELSAPRPDICKLFFKKPNMGLVAAFLVLSLLSGVDGAGAIAGNRVFDVLAAGIPLLVVGVAIVGVAANAGNAVFVVGVDGKETSWGLGGGGGTSPFSCVCLAASGDAVVVVTILGTVGVGLIPF